MITKYPPNTIWLGGEKTEIGDIPASETITPGMLVERFNSSGAVKFRKHSTAGAAGNLVALDQSMLNKGPDDTYAAGDLMQVIAAQKGTSLWMLIGAGANIAAGDRLASAGNGLLQAQGAGVASFVALENKNNTAGPGNARIRVEAL